MSSSYTNLLGLVLPVQGELEGTWGDTINQQLTQLLDDAVANAVTLNLTAGDVTLTSLSGAADQARMAILIVTGTPGITRTVTAPSKSKVYQVINQSDSSVVIKGAATTGVTILAGASGVVAWNGSDFIEIGAIASNRTINGVLQLSAGTATTPSLTTTGDTNTGLYFPAADTVAIATGGVKRVEVDANGNVGLGVTPSAFSAGYIGFQLGGNPVIASQNNLSLAGNAYYNAGWKYITSNYASRYDSNFNNGGIHAWFTAPSGTAGNAISFTQAMTLDASGRLLVGLTSGPTTVTVATPSTNSNLGVYSNSQITLSNPTTVGAYSQIAFGYNSGTSISNAAAAIGFISTSADTWGKGDLVFATRSVTTDTAPTERARIDSSGNFGIGTSSPGGRLQVSGGRTLLSSTTGDSYILNLRNPSFTNGCFLGSPGENMFAVSAADGSERARIDSSGNLLVGTTTNTLPVCRMSIGFPGANTQYGLSFRPAADSTTQIAFLNAAGTDVGSITETSSATAYNTSSDYRLKDNQQPLTGSGEFIDALKPKTWDWKSDGSKGVGFIAHEVQEVSPSSVVGEKDAVDDEGKPVYQAMEYGSAEFIANIIAELQSLRARIAALEAK